MSDQLFRLQASLAEVVRQRDEALARCANMAGDVAALQAQIEDEAWIKSRAEAIRQRDIALIKIDDSSSSDPRRKDGQPRNEDKPIDSVQSRRT